MKAGEIRAQRLVLLAQRRAYLLGSFAHVAGNELAGLRVQRVQGFGDDWVGVVAVGTPALSVALRLVAGEQDVDELLGGFAAQVSAQFAQTVNNQFAGHVGKRELLEKI